MAPAATRSASRIAAPAKIRERDEKTGVQEEPLIFLFFAPLSSDRIKGLGGFLTEVAPLLPPSLGSLRHEIRTSWRNQDETRRSSYGAGPHFKPCYPHEELVEAGLPAGASSMLHFGHLPGWF
jgi:hypothetical protein